MATNTIIKKLFSVAKKSSSFKGMTEKQIWDACSAYKDRSDATIRDAIKNIRKKDTAVVEKSEEGKRVIKEGKVKMDELKEKEAVDREKDEFVAEKILEDFFNS